MTSTEQPVDAFLRSVATPRRQARRRRRVQLLLVDGPSHRRTAQAPELTSRMIAFIETDRAIEKQRS